MDEIREFTNKKIDELIERKKKDETIDIIEDIAGFMNINIKISDLKFNLETLKNENKKKVKFMKAKGDIIITDPCYIINKSNDEDWSVCEYSERMDKLGIYNYIARDTLYGDWSCTTYEKETEKEIGSFCADAGLVGVFLLDEVLKYNPQFDYHTEKPWTTTLIKDFDGVVRIEVFDLGFYEYKGEKYKNEEVRVIGEGNINFFTSQSGL